MKTRVQRLDADRCRIVVSGAEAVLLPARCMRMKKAGHQITAAAAP